MRAGRSDRQQIHSSALAELQAIVKIAGHRVSEHARHCIDAKRPAESHLGRIQTTRC